MNIDILLTVFLITAIFSVGFSIRTFFIPMPFFSIFIEIPLAWVLGNAIVFPVLYFFALLNRLNFLTRETILWTGSLVIIIGVVSLLYATKKRKLIIPSRTDTVLIGVIILFLAPLAFYTVFSYLQAWDAVGIWFIKAKSFYLAQGLADNVLFQSKEEYLYSNKAYPLGIPLVISLFYKLLGNGNDQVVKLYLLVYYGLLPIFSTGVLRHYFPTLSGAWALLYGAILYFVPNYVLYAVNGYVDIALALVLAISLFFFLHAIELLQDKKRDRYFLLSIAIALCSAFIKGEGMVFTLQVVGLSAVIFFAFAVKNNKLFQSFRHKQSIPLIVFILLQGAAHFSWNIYRRSNNLDFYYDSIQPISGLLGRIKLIAFHYTDHITNTNEVGIITFLSILFFIFLVSETIVQKKYVWLLAVAPLVVQMSIYTAVYIITPVPLHIQLPSSFERLFLHCVPLMSIASFFLFYKLQLSNKQ